MDRNAIKTGKPVRVEFGAACTGDLNLPVWEVQKRLNNVTGVVDCEISNTNTEEKAYWVIIDAENVPPVRTRKSQEENPAIEEALSRRQRRAPYFASELTPVQH